ncbi:cytochrome P450 6g1-like [Lutzomyia longipalpis]|uniref:cytochrome P450 6g1-like n=1 Tax=Lutzomyia longipalpis TaxID=7200 RepID=UPI0024846B97|nr:cytochrome P450 6g1-like [Lutzomyia longipalpis]
MNSEDTIGKDNLFAVKSVRWKAIRSKLSPVFTTGKLKNFFLLMLNVTQTLEEKLSMDIADEPREYEMRDLASYFTTDTITICIFGVQANSLLNPNGEFYRSARKTFDLNWKRSIELLTCFFLPELAIRLRFTLFSKETNNFLRSSINYVMEERVKSGTRRNDMIDALIAMKNEDPDLFKGDTIVAQAGSFLLANFETSSSVISFALYELARHPEIQENLRNEIKDYAMKYGSLQYETLNEMEYLNGVVQGSSSRFLLLQTF